MNWRWGCEASQHHGECRHLCAHWAPETPFETRTEGAAVGHGQRLRIALRQLKSEPIYWILLNLSVHSRKISWSWDGMIFGSFNDFSWLFLDEPCAVVRMLLWGGICCRISFKLPRTKALAPCALSIWFLDLFRSGTAVRRMQNANRITRQFKRGSSQVEWHEWLRGTEVMGIYTHVI